eukprot:gene2112-5918_t
MAGGSPFAEMQEGVKKVNTEHDAAAAEADKKPEPDAAKPKTKTVWEVDKEKSNLFQFLDRPQAGLRAANGMMDRGYLARKLLCLEKGPASLKDALAVATLEGNADSGAINYSVLCKVSKEVEIPEEKEEEKKEEKKAEETAES